MMEEYDDALEQLTESEIKELESFMHSNETSFVKRKGLKDLADEENRESKPNFCSFDKSKLREHMEKTAIADTFDDTRHVQFVKKDNKPSNAAKFSSQPVRRSQEELDKLLNDATPSQMEEICELLEIDANAATGDEEIVKCGLPPQQKYTMEENSEEETGVVAILDEIRARQDTEQTLTLNNRKIKNSEALAVFAYLTETGCKIKDLNMANCNLSDVHIEELAASLNTNVSLKSLNIETNKISGKAMIELFRTIGEGKCNLNYVKVSNQLSKIGYDGEEEICKMLEKNEKITKLSHNFQYQNFRYLSERLLTKNGDIARKNRMNKKS